MLRVPLSVHAECAGERCGDVVGVVVDRASRTLVNYVVRVTTPDHPVERLVPRARVNVSDPDMVRLTCTRAELDEMPPLTVPEYHIEQRPDLRSATYFYPYAYGQPGPVLTAPEYVRGDSEQLPEGTSLIRDPMHVEASNGRVGKLVGFVLDDANHITHFYTLLEHRHGSPELFLPLSAVSYVDDHSVYLRLDKGQLDSLPLTPASHHARLSLTPPFKHVELAAKIYDRPEGAREALDRLRSLQLGSGNSIKIRDAAVLVRESDGTTRIYDMREAGLGKSAALGAAAGGLVAMLGPVGLVAGAATGAAIGAFAGPKLDLGFPDAFLRRLQDKLKEDHSALVVLVEHDWAQGLSEKLGQLDGVITQATLVDTIVQAMLAEEHQVPVAST